MLGLFESGLGDPLLHTVNAILNTVQVLFLAYLAAKFGHRPP